MEKIKKIFSSKLATKLSLVVMFLYMLLILFFLDNILLFEDFVMGVNRHKVIWALTKLIQYFVMFNKEFLEKPMNIWLRALIFSTSLYGEYSLAFSV